MTVNASNIDFTVIEFPTDALTIKALRKHRPHAFDVPPPDDYRYSLRNGYYERSTLDLMLASTLDWERMLAEVVFRETLGLPKAEDLPVPENQRNQIINTLCSDYVSLGMASGKHQAREMLRRIEKQAEEQARQHGGRSR